MIESLRKAQIVDSIGKLVQENQDLTVSEIIKAVYRRKNFKVKTENLLYLEANDEELSQALELTIKELEEDKNS